MQISEAFRVTQHEIHAFKQFNLLKSVISTIMYSAPSF